MVATLRLRAVAIIRLGLLAMVFVQVDPAGAQSVSTSLERRLAAAHQSRFSGQSLRATLQTLSQATNVDHWLDRRVDPEQKVAVAAAGPTVEGAFASVAESVGLSSLPIDNLVLVGRREWVDRTGALIMAAAVGAAPGEIEGRAGAAVSMAAGAPPQSIAWPFLTTPAEALQTVAEKMNASADGVDLPHDLWPAFENDAIRPATVLTLIGAEFDQWLRRVDAAIGAEPMPEHVAVEQAYPAAAVEKLRDQLRRVDPEATIQVRQTKADVRGGALVHREIQRSIYRSKQRRRPVAGPPPTPSQKRFTINWQNAPADKALASLTGAGGWTLSVQPEAQEAVTRLINLQADELPLDELIQQVARQVGLRATFRDDTWWIETP